MQGGSLYTCYDGFWYDQAVAPTHDLLHEGGHANHSANMTMMTHF